MLRDWARGLPPGHSVIVARYHCYSGDFAGSYCGDHMWVSGMGPGAHLNRRLVLGLASHAYVLPPSKTETKAESNELAISATPPGLSRRTCAITLPAKAHLMPLHKRMVPRRKLWMVEGNIELHARWRWAATT